MSARYDRSCYREVVTYEFFLPLTRESELRQALDELFFADTVRRRLEDVGSERLQDWVPRHEAESASSYLDRIVGMVSDRFGGYSITHVNGRYRSGPLVSRHSAAERFASGERYLVDETTAVVRFTIPVEPSGVRYDGDFDEVDDAVDPARFAEDVALIHHLFFATFVEAVVHDVSGEDEIWLSQEWNGGRRLFVFTAKGAE